MESRRSARNVLFLLLHAVCNSLGVNTLNSEVALWQLARCRTIQGHLHFRNIALPECASFPCLVEVTDYLLIVQVADLTSLATLFPNLAVIRGDRLYWSHALVVYNNGQLRDASLPHLTLVLRGGVRITDNPQLCDADTDWGAVTRTGSSFNQVQSVRPGGCPACAAERERTNSDNCIQHLCPAALQQRPPPCPGGCGVAGCSPDSHLCCSPLCLGGCIDPLNSSACVACRAVRVGQRCMDACPTHLRQYRHTCVSESSFDATSTERRARRCGSQEAEVNSLADAEKLSGCQRLASLTIKIIGPAEELQNELRHLLVSLREIGRLTVESTVLTSLDFLAGVRRIGPRTRQPNDSLDSVVVVVKNTLLESLPSSWDKLTLNGRANFMDNPRLCLFQIDRFTSSADLLNISARSVLEYGAIEVNVSLVGRGADSAVQTCLHPAPMAHLCTYTLHFSISATNVCRTSSCDKGWVSRSVSATPSEGGGVVLLLGDLLPSTRYAIEVTVSQGGGRTKRSQVAYVVTAMAHPLPPSNLSCTVAPDGILSAQWLSNDTHRDTLYSVQLRPLPRPTRLCSAGFKATASELFSKQGGQLLQSDKQREEAAKIITPNRYNLSYAEVCGNEDEYGENNVSCTQKSTLTLPTPELGRYVLSVSACVPENCQGGETDACWHCSCLPTQTICSAPSDEEFNPIRSLSAVSSNTSFSSDGAQPLHGTQAGAVVASAAPAPKRVWLINADVDKKLISMVHYFNIAVNGQVSSHPQCSSQASEVSQGVELKGLVLGNNTISVSVVTFDREYLFSNITVEMTQEDVFYLAAPLDCCVVLPSVSQALTLVSNPSLPMVRGVIVLLGLLGTLVCTLALLAITRKRHSKLALKYSASNRTCDIDVEEATAIAEEFNAAELLINPSLVEWVAQVGKGNYAEVWQGRFSDQATPKHRTIEDNKIALKKPLKMKNAQDIRNFFREATLLKLSESQHVVRILGVVVQTDRVAYIMEHMMQDLQKYLAHNRDTITVEEQFRFVYESSAAMKHLQALRIVHCDLSSRNILLDHSSRSRLKIADFGQAFQLKCNEPFVVAHKEQPVFWMPPEALDKNQYSPKTDVWSFGVLVWEITNPGRKPFEMLDTKQVRLMVSNGHTLSVSHTCPLPLAILQTQCFQAQPDHRPCFTKILHDITLAQERLHCPAAGLGAPPRGDGCCAASEWRDSKREGQQHHCVIPCYCLESSCQQSHPACTRNTAPLTSYRNNTRSMGVRNKCHQNNKHSSNGFNDEEHKDWFRDSHTGVLKSCVLREDHQRVPCIPDGKSQISPEMPSLPSFLNQQIVIPKLENCSSRYYVNIESCGNRISEPQSTSRISSACKAEQFSHKKWNPTRDGSTKIVGTSSIVNSSSVENEIDCIQFYPHFDDKMTSINREAAISTKLRRKKHQTFKLNKVKEVVSTTSTSTYNLTAVQTREETKVNPVSMSLPCVQIDMDESHVRNVRELNNKKGCETRRSTEEMSFRICDFETSDS